MRRPYYAGTKFFTLFIYVLLNLLLASCASTPEKMQKRINAGEYAEAVSMGTEFLNEEPGHPDVSKVWDLVWEADYKIASVKDSVAGYEAFENKYARKETPTQRVVKPPEKPEKKPAKKKKTKKARKKEAVEEQSESQAEISSYNSTPTYKDLPDDFIERKSNAYYRDVTVPAGTALAAKEFQSLYADSSLKPKAHELELQLAWKEAEEEGTVSEWKMFRTTYPEHTHIKEALTIETDLAWKEAQQKGTEEALTTFQLEYPNFPNIQNVQEKVCQLAWNNAQTKNSVESYRIFRDKYTRCGASIVQAREKEEQLAWNRALVDASVTSFDAFIKDYPDSIHIKEALDKVCDLAWTEAQAKKTGIALRNFREKYPRCTAQVAIAAAL